MPEATQNQTQAQTSSATAAEKEAIRIIEAQLGSLGSIMESFKDSMDSINKTITDENSNFFKSMTDTFTSSLKQNESENRVYEEAKEQNEAARKMISDASGPERGQAGFWEAAFAVTPEKQEDVQAKAITKALSGAELKKELAGLFSTSTIKEAVSKGDDRTTGEKALDFMGLGFVNKIKHHFQDSDIRKEEKATKKDQDFIARSMKDKKRLEAKLRKAKNGGGTDEEIEELTQKLHDLGSDIKSAEKRINERKEPMDIYADLIEKKGNAIEGAKSPLMDMNPVDVIKSLSNPLTADELMHSTEKDEKKDAIVDAVKPPVVPLEPEKKKPEFPDIDDAEDLEDYYAKLSESMENPSGPAKAEPKEPTAADKDSAGMKGEEQKQPDDGKQPVVPGKSPGGIEEPGDAKETADITRMLDTKLRPDFYREGTKAFRMINGGQLVEGIAAGMSSAGGFGGKGGLYAVLGTAAIASLGAIAQAGAAVKELWDTKKQVQENLNNMYDKNRENNQKMKKGYNDEMRDALDELMAAEKELNNTWLFDSKEKAKVEAAKKKFEAAKERQAKFMEAVDAAGISRSDVAAINKFKEEYDKNGGKMPKAGNASQPGAANSSTPAAQVNTEKVETAEEKAAREEETQYKATKRALTDSDVQKQNLETAAATGKQIDEKLTGRK